MSWIDDQIREIESSPTLVNFGLALALTHVLTHYAWSGGDMPVRYLLASSANVEPVCWPGLAFCAKMKVFGPAAVFWLGRAYALLALATAGLFATRRAAAGWFGLASVTLVKLALYVQDYRFANEFHLILFAASLFYLGLGGKRRALAALIVGIFVSAGLHHLGVDWFTGAGVPPFIFKAGVPRWFRTHDLWPIAATLATWGMTVGALGLLARAPLVRGLALAQLALLILSSTSIVGWATALMMLLVLAPFGYEAAAKPTAARGRRAPVALAALALLAVLQIPSLIDPQREAFRWGAVSMFDSNRRCRAAVIARFANRTIDLSRANHEEPHWMECDVYTAFDQIRRLCPSLRAEGDFEGLTWQLQQQLSPSRPAEVIATTADACAAGVNLAALTPEGGAR